MHIRGLVFAGAFTDRRGEMTAFVETVLGLARAPHASEFADMFQLADGTRFAVADERDDRPGTSRTVGFLVDDVPSAREELISAGAEVDDPQENERHRYVHFVAPDGEIYELVEELGSGPTPAAP